MLKSDLKLYVANILWFFFFLPVLIKKIQKC